MPRKPIFLDRDGVINHDLKPYIVSADQLEPIAGSLKAIARLTRSGYDVYVASNQQGVAKGFIPEDELPKMSERIRRLLEPLGGEIVHFEYCCAMEGDGNPCRKPSPGMIHLMRDRFDLELDGAFMVGDRWSDIEAAARAGLRPLLVYTGSTSPGEEATWEFRPERAFADLAAAVDYVLSSSAPPESAGKTGS